MKESYKLKDSQTSFYDPETKFKVVGNRPSELGPKGKGKLTAAAIVAGGLIEVSTKAKSAQDAGDDDSSDLPEDFPARKWLVAGGYDSLAKVGAVSDDDLIKLKGVDKKSVEHIRAALK
jgi:hypothetical protein